MPVTGPYIERIGGPPPADDTLLLSTAQSERSCLGSCEFWRPWWRALRALGFADGGDIEPPPDIEEPRRSRSCLGSPSNRLAPGPVITSERLRSGRLGACREARTRRRTPLRPPRKPVDSRSCFPHQTSGKSGRLTPGPLLTRETYIPGQSPSPSLALTHIVSCTRYCPSPCERV
jgi:hypothetical protein